MVHRWAVYFVCNSSVIKTLLYISNHLSPTLIQSIITVLALMSWIYLFILILENRYGENEITQRIIEENNTHLRQFILIRQFDISSQNTMHIIPWKIPLYKVWINIIVGLFFINLIEKHLFVNKIIDKKVFFDQTNEDLVGPFKRV